MGEYATYNGQQIKIGTCEQMYYLRADQVHLIQPLNGNVNPRSMEDAQAIRFRFPFPQEDNIKPGSFDDHDYGLAVSGIEPPDDPDEMEHYSLQFTRNYPQAGGLLLSFPCPRSRAGKLHLKAVDGTGIKLHYNGYSGAVHIHSQRLVDGKLVLVCRCGDCGALYRVPTLDAANSVLDALEKMAGAEDHQHRLDQARNPDVKLANRGDYWREVAARIVAGYCETNFWTQKAVAA